MKAILYARVSNRSQDERGLSLPAQFAELRTWAAANGYVVVGEVADTGGKGSKRDDLDRAGLEEVYDLSEKLALRAGDVVVAQSWDRFGQDEVPAMIGYRLAMVSGARLRTPNDPNDAEDDGAALVRMVSRWNAGRERKETARRTRSRKLELARKGHVVPHHTATYGFSYAGEQKARAYEIHVERAAVVRRICDEIAAGTGVRTLVRKLDAERVPLPPGKGRRSHGGWNRQFIRDTILRDCYKPHTADELDALVAAGRLRPDVRDRTPTGSGVWWYEGRNFEGDRHRVAVPVPNIGVPRETLDEARRRLAKNRPASSASGRIWTLSRGVMVCAACGRNMVTHTVRSKRHDRVHLYYRCQSTGDTLRGLCPAPLHVPAERAERAVWEFVSDLETRPERVVAALDNAIERERARLRTDPEKEARELRRRIDALAVRRAEYQDLVVSKLMTKGELRARLEGLEGERAGLERRVEECGRAGDRLRELEELRGWYARAVGGDDLMANAEANATHNTQTYMRMQFLATSAPEQRRRYETLGLSAVAVGKHELEVSGVFGTDSVYTSEASRKPGARLAPPLCWCGRFRDLGSRLS